MMNGIFFAHSGLRYLVLLVGLVALFYYAYALAGRKQPDRASSLIGSIYVGLLDLQILLGIVLMATGIFYGALIGHLAMMLLAAAVAHVAFIAAKRTVAPGRHHIYRLAGVAASLILILMGIMAIGRAIIGTGRPGMGA
jgi:hypothetical protein